MGVFDNEQGNFVFAPATGKPDISFVVTGALTRIKNNDTTNKYNYKKLDKSSNQVNFGYYDVLNVDIDKELLINVWKIYFALQKLNPDEGDTITISHPSAGEYKITKS